MGLYFKVCLHFLPQPHQKHFNSTFDQSTVIQTAPPAGDLFFFNNDFPKASNHKQQESPYQENSDSSVEDDIDIDSITPVRKYHRWSQNIYSKIYSVKRLQPFHLSSQTWSGEDSTECSSTL